MHTEVCDRFGIEYPVFAFTHSPDVVAAVARAGGFGVLNASGCSPEELDRELTRLDDETDGHPYGLACCMSVEAEEAGVENLEEILARVDAAVPAEHRRFVEDILARFGLAPPSGSTRLYGWNEQASGPLVDVALSHRISLIANALGPPPPALADEARARGICVAAVARTVEEAWKEVQAGADIIVAQGMEAAGPTGEISSLVLLPQVVDAVRPTPVLAAGGIGNGRQAAAALALGAEGVWTGTVWLTAAEAGTPPVLLDKLLQANARDTVRSTCIDGRLQRQLRTALTEAWDAPGAPDTLPMPLQFALMRGALERIEEAQPTELVGTRVGQVVGQLKVVRFAADIVQDFVWEFDEAAERIGSLRAATAEVTSKR